MDDGFLLTLCRKKLYRHTPIQADCGKLCARACCHCLPGERVSGMLLFPGEEMFYRGAKGFRLQNTPAGVLCSCTGRCSRRERPLACRLFPLLPVWRDGKIAVEMDLRAAAVCPLFHAPMDLLDADFVQTVRTVGEWLARSPRQREALSGLASAQEELRRLRSLLGADKRG